MKQGAVMNHDPSGDNDCSQCGEQQSRIYGVEIWGAYDGVLFWECPTCGHRWHRWPEGDFRRRRAEEYVTRAHPEPPTGPTGCVPVGL